ncbi:diguanylate cyclase [Congregibacter sp.]|uniref:diguanylate cyclase n=1 Tax=Congregibacter sp. TaxID=2744308 RepID=UPI003F6B5325
MPDSSNNQRSFLGRLTLRQRLAVAFVTGVLSAATLAVSSYLAVNFGAKQADQLQAAREQLSFVDGLAIAATGMQFSATRYVYLGHESAQERVTSLGKQWNDLIDVCAEQGCLEETQLDDIRVHLQAFEETFLLVSQAYRDISSSLSSEFAHVKNSAPGLAWLSEEAHNSNSSIALHINSINDHLSTIEAELRAYFVTSDAQRVRDAETHLTELKRHLALALAANQSDAERASVFAAAGFDIEKVESMLYSNIQKIRSYAYLVNVVMPSEARELEYLATEIATAKNVEIDALLVDMHRNRMNFYRWQIGIIALVLLLTIPVFFWVVSSVTLPLRRLSRVFRRLSEGSEDVVDAAVTRDEIGDLFTAAEAFRRENIRERELLRDYKQLSRSLEAQVTERTKELNAKNAELDRLASIDKLTSTLNRRALDNTLAAELRRAQRYERPLALLLMDIDLFKQVNDQHGHLTGDRVLVTLSERISDNLRASDLLGRWGGEEFLVICPETNLEQARSVAEKVRAAIEVSDFGLQENITISIGVSVAIEGSTAEALVAEADRALYLAKSRGRNCVCIGPMTLTPQSSEHLKPG